MSSGSSLRELATRALAAACMACLVVVLLLGLAKLANVLLLFFGGVVLAALLRGVARWLCSKTGMPIGPALGVTIFLLLGLLIGAGWLVAPRVYDQLAQLPTYWGDGRDSVTRILGQHPWLDRAFSYLRREATLPSTRGLASQALGAFSSLLNALERAFSSGSWGCTWPRSPNTT